MKRSFTIILSLVLLFQSMIGVTAYTFDDNPLYTIEVPEGFYQVGEDKFSSSKGETFSVYLTDNTEEKLCFADLNDTEISEYAEEIATNGATALKELGLNGSVEVVSVEKMKHSNGKTALVMVFKASVNNDGEVSIRYQKMYEFTCVDNKYSFTYNPENENQINSFDDAFNSIVINEEQIQSVGDKITTAALYGGVIILIALGIVRFIKPVKKKK